MEPGSSSELPDDSQVLKGKEIKGKEAKVEGPASKEGSIDDDDQAVPKIPLMCFYWYHHLRCEYYNNGSCVYEHRSLDSPVSKPLSLQSKGHPGCHLQRCPFSQDLDRQGKKLEWKARNCVLAKHCGFAFRNTCFFWYHKEECPGGDSCNYAHEHREGMFVGFPPPERRSRHACDLEHCPMKPGMTGKDVEQERARRSQVAQAAREEYITKLGERLRQRRRRDTSE